MFPKARSDFHKLLFVFIFLHSALLYASPASINGVKSELLFYDYKDSSAIHETQGTPTKGIFEANDINKINKNYYLTLEELEEKVSPAIRTEFNKNRANINKEYSVRIILWEKDLPQSTSVRSTRLIPLYPRIANNLQRLEEDKGDKHDIKFVKEISSTPLLDFIASDILDIKLPTPLEEPHLYFLGIYITKSDEVPGFTGNNRSLSHWINTDSMKPEKDLTQYLTKESDVNKLKLFLVTTDYLDILTTRSAKAEKDERERKIVESVSKHLIPSPGEQNRKVVLFVKNKAGQTIKTLEVQTGDIAVRLGVDLVIAAGLGPIPSRFENDKSGIFNWNVTNEALERLFLLGITPLLSVEEMFLAMVNSELALPYSNSFASYSKESLLTDEMRVIRGAVKTIDFNNLNFDGDNSNDPPIRYFNRLDPEHPSPYLLTLGDLINADLLKERLHYYPGTIFFSHAGIISVEKNKNGEKEVWVYDAYPKTKLFPNGIRRVPFAEMFGKDHGSYGAILRLRDDLDLDSGSKTSSFDIAQQAAIQARKILIESIVFNPANKVYFDYAFNWQDPNFVGCSEFIWKIFGEGASQLGVTLNLVPNLSMLRIPTQFTSQIGQNVELMLQISPQDLATSPFVTRIADFDSELLNDEIEIFSVSGEAQDLSEIYNLLNPRTGHPVIKIY